MRIPFLPQVELLRPWLNLALAGRRRSPPGDAHEGASEAPRQRLPDWHLAPA